jgi:hypothetical protein
MYDDVQALSCKTFAVFGATGDIAWRLSSLRSVHKAHVSFAGGVGLECVYQALADGHKVRALARDPSR